jgi:ferritin-like metal-binding protein YciE
MRKDVKRAKTREKLIREIFSEIGQKPFGQRCRAVEAMIEELHEIVRVNEGIVRDLAIIAQLRKIRNSRIATCSSLRHWAGMLGEASVAATIDQILESLSTSDSELEELSEEIIYDEELLIAE